jgi:hypothetical protein
LAPLTAGKAYRARASHYNNGLANQRSAIFGVFAMKQRSYRSEATLFIEQLKTQRPHLEQQQQQGRSIWWDKPQDLETSQERQSAKVAQKPYVYHNA